MRIRSFKILLPPRRIRPLLLRPLLIFFGLFLQYGAIADEYVIKNWNTANGLPDSTVRGIAQTPDGFVWVGTDGGVARFDGIRFEIFDVATVPNLGANAVWDMLVDSKGVLWIATNAGLTRYQDGDFVFFQLAADDVLGAVWRIEEDSQGELWLLGDDGLRHMRHGEPTKITPPAELGIGQIQEMSAGLDGEMYFGTDTGLWRKDSNDVFTQLLESDRIDSVAVATDGRVFFIKQFQSLSYYVDEEIHPIELPEGERVHMMHALPDGDVWVGALTLSRAFRVRGNEVMLLNQEDGLYGNRPITFMDDRDGNVWMGLNSGGLYRLHEQRLDVYWREDGIDQGKPTSVAVTGENIPMVALIGGGFLKWDGTQFNHVLPVERRRDFAASTGVAAAANGDVWIGTLREQIHRVRDNQIIETTGSDGGTRCLLIGRSNVLWRGTSTRGLDRITDSGFENFNIDDGLADNRILDLAEEVDGVVWVGTHRGLSRIEGNEVKKYTTEDGLTSERIRSVFVDSEDTLWIGTDGFGLMRHNNGNFATVDRSHGLPSNGINQIEEDDFGNLWLGTNLGLFRASRDELARVASGESDLIYGTLLAEDEGLTSPQFGSRFQPSSTKAPDGSLWFCSNSGVVRVDPARFSVRMPKPDVHVVAVQIDGERIRQYDVTKWDSVNVPPNSVNFEISYTAITFDRPEQTQFRYRLGNDEDWIYAGPRRTANFTRTPPGKYQFEVQASVQDGVWSTTNTFLDLTIQPAFWQTFWFRATVWIVGLGSLIGIVRLISLRRARAQLAQLERERELEAERSRIARDMHDELGASLTRIKLLGEQIGQNTDHGEETSGHAQRITQTAGDLARGMDEIVWAINPSKDELISFSDYLASTAEDCLRDSDIRLRLDIPDELPERELSSNLRHNLLLACKEAMHNALKYSEANQVKVTLAVNSTTIKIVVEDDGKGFTGKIRATGGNGLKNMRSRLESVAGSCQIDQVDSKGTRVTLEAPFEN